MKSEELRQKITIEKRESSFDEIGNSEEEWTTHHTCRASVNTMSGKEFMAAKVEKAENVLTFRIRYCNALKDLTPQDYRIVWNDKEYDIQHIDNYMFKNEYLTIKAVRRE